MGGGKGKGKERYFSWATAGTLVLVLVVCMYALCQSRTESFITSKSAYTDEVAVASRALVLLMFLACSRTLDFASSIDGLDTVERARTNCAGVAAFEADGMRNLAAERDMLAVTTTKTRATAVSGNRPGKTGAEETSWGL